MQSRITGTTLPVLEIGLEANDVIVSASGEVSWMTPNVQMRTTTNTGGARGLWGAITRAVGGGGLFMTEFSASGGLGAVAFAAKVPGQIFEMQVQPGRGYLVHRHGFLCATQGVEVSAALQRSLGAGVFGGEGFVLQRLGGTCTAWVELGGEIVSHELAAGKSLLVHPGHVGMFDDSVSFDITSDSRHRQRAVRRRWAVPGATDRAGADLARRPSPCRTWRTRCRPTWRAARCRRRRRWKPVWRARCCATSSAAAGEPLTVTAAPPVAAPRVARTVTRRSIAGTAVLAGSALLLRADFSPPRHVPAPGDVRALDALAAAFMAKYSVPALSLAIGHAGVAMHVRAFRLCRSRNERTSYPGSSVSHCQHQQADYGDDDRYASRAWSVATGGSGIRGGGHPRYG